MLGLERCLLRPVLVCFLLDILTQAQITAHRLASIRHLAYMS